MKTVPKEKRDDIGSLLIRVVDCLDTLGKCDEAREAYFRYYNLVLRTEREGKEDAPTAADLYAPQRCPK